MSRFKDEWNERYYRHYDEARDRGASHDEAEYHAEANANELINDYLDAADMLRKQGKGE
jgi:hypothetical protein